MGSGRTPAAVTSSHSARMSAQAASSSTSSGTTAAPYTGPGRSAQAWAMRRWLAASRRFRPPPSGGRLPSSPGSGTDGPRRTAGTTARYGPGGGASMSPLGVAPV